MSLEISGLNAFYGKRQILHDVSFTAGDGRLLCLLGPNGVGKSTLFKAILKILPEYEGQIYLDGKDTSGLSVREMARRVAYIPQSSAPTFNYSVFDMVMMGMAAQLPGLGSPGRRQEEMVEDALDHLGISHLRDKGFSHISGGERQLVLIARAMVQEAHTLIMDEPTANLDYGNQILVLSQARRLTEEGYTVIQSTHQPEQAFMFADEIIAMKDGRVLEQGPPGAIIRRELIHKLYGVEVDVQSICGDSMRVCVPMAALRNRRGKPQTE